MSNGGILATFQVGDIKILLSLHSLSLDFGATGRSHVVLSLQRCISLCSVSWESCSYYCGSGSSLIRSRYNLIRDFDRVRDQVTSSRISRGGQSNKEHTRCLLSFNHFRHRITIFNAVIGKGASVVGTCLEPCACDVQAQRIKCDHLTPVPYRRSRAHSSRHDHALLAGDSGTRTGCLLVEAPSTSCRWRPLPGPGGSNPPPFVSEHIFTVFTR